MNLVSKFTSSIWSVLVWALIVFVLANQVACGPFIRDIHNLQSHQGEQDSQLADQEARIQALEDQLSALQALVAITDSSNQSALAALQAQIQALNVQVAVLNGYTSITAVLDPCGDSPSVIDEVLLKLSNGKVIASFSDKSSGKNTRFSVLAENTYYGTTDGSNCTFKIVNGNLAY